MINSIATADHWSIPFRPPHFITFFAPSRKRIGFSASGSRMKKAIEEPTGWRASLDRSNCLAARHLPCFLSHQLVDNRTRYIGGLGG
jgi:hypothetical protein